VCVCVCVCVSCASSRVCSSVLSRVFFVSFVSSLSPIPSFRFLFPLGLPFFIILLFCRFVVVPFNARTILFFWFLCLRVWFFFVCRRMCVVCVCVCLCVCVRACAFVCVSVFACVRAVRSFVPCGCFFFERFPFVRALECVCVSCLCACGHVSWACHGCVRVSLASRLGLYFPPSISYTLFSISFPFWLPLLLHILVPPFCCRAVQCSIFP
jgi:hypothetical protein